MNVTLRPEQPTDYRTTESIAREAFYNLYFPGAHEHYLISQMRNHPDFIPELSTVVEVDGELAGGIYFTKSYIVDDNGNKLDTITFGPVFIAPK